MIQLTVYPAGAAGTDLLAAGVRRRRLIASVDAAGNDLSSSRCERYPTTFAVRNKPIASIACHEIRRSIGGKEFFATMTANR
jgi:hypothetical protein